MSVCWRCGAPVNPNDKFCGVCAAPMAGAPGAQPPAGPPPYGQQPPAGPPQYQQPPGPPPYGQQPPMGPPAGPPFGQQPPMGPPAGSPYGQQPPMGPPAGPPFGQQPPMGPPAGPPFGQQPPMGPPAGPPYGQQPPMGPPAGPPYGQQPPMGPPAGPPYGQQPPMGPPAGPPFGQQPPMGPPAGPPFGQQPPMGPSPYYGQPVAGPPPHAQQSPMGPPAGSPVDYGQQSSQGSQEHWQSPAEPPANLGLQPSSPHQPAPMAAAEPYARTPLPGPAVSLESQGLYGHPPALAEMRIAGSEAFEATAFSGGDPRGELAPTGAMTPYPQGAGSPGVAQQSPSRRTPAFDAMADTNKAYDSSGELRGFLYSFHNDPKGEFWPLLSGHNVIGRFDSGETLDISIKDPTTSSRHAILLSEGPRKMVLHDTGSTNGTFVNEQRVDQQGSIELHDGDRIRLGAFLATIRLVTR